MKFRYVLACFVSASVVVFLLPGHLGLTASAVDYLHDHGVMSNDSALDAHERLLKWSSSMLSLLLVLGDLGARVMTLALYFTYGLGWVFEIVAHLLYFIKIYWAVGCTVSFVVGNILFVWCFFRFKAEMEDFVILWRIAEAARIDSMRRSLAFRTLNRESRLTPGLLEDIFVRRGEPENLGTARSYVGLSYRHLIIARLRSMTARVWFFFSGIPTDSIVLGIVTQVRREDCVRAFDENQPDIEAVPDLRIMAHLPMVCRGGSQVCSVPVYDFNNATCLEVLFEPAILNQLDATFGSSMSYTFETVLQKARTMGSINVPSAYRADVEYGSVVLFSVIRKARQANFRLAPPRLD
jgi:hypothetical protein